MFETINQSQSCDKIQGESSVTFYPSTYRYIGVLNCSLDVRICSHGCCLVISPSHPLVVAQAYHAHERPLSNKIQSWLVRSPSKNAKIIGVFCGFVLNMHAPKMPEHCSLVKVNQSMQSAWWYSFSWGPGGTQLGPRITTWCRRCSSPHRVPQPHQFPHEKQLTTIFEPTKSLSVVDQGTFFHSLSRFCLAFWASGEGISFWWQRQRACGEFLATKMWIVSQPKTERRDSSSENACLIPNSGQNCWIPKNEDHVGRIQDLKLDPFPPCTW